MALRLYNKNRVSRGSICWLKTPIIFANCNLLGFYVSHPAYKLPLPQMTDRLPEVLQLIRHLKTFSSQEGKQGPASNLQDVPHLVH